MKYFFNLTKKLFALIFISLIFTSMSNAQVAGYSFTQTAGTYTEITGGTVVYSGTFDDGLSTPITIPPFNYDGINYTSLTINANGHIAFGTYSSTTNYTPLSSTTNATGGIVAVFGRDLNNAATGVPEIRYELIANEFIVQYKDVRRYNVTGEVLSFQIRLNTSNNNISFVYGGTITPGSNTTYPQIGLKGPNNTFATNINNRMIAASGGDWINSTAGTANTSTMYFNSANPATVPSSGLTFTFTPPNYPPAISYTTLTNTSSTTNRSLDGVVITDLDGVNGTSGTAPRIYFKKSSDANVFGGNTSTDNGWKWTESTGSSPFSFTIDYSIINGGSIVMSDTVQYFVVAQDLAITPLVGSNPSAGFVGTSVSSITSAPTTPNSYIITDLPMSGVYTVGLAAFRSATGKNIYFEKRTRNVIKDLNGIDSQIDLNSNDDKNSSQIIDRSPKLIEVTEEYYELMENGQPFDQSFFANNDALGVYPTITAAVADVNLRGISGPVTLSLTDANYPSETYPIEFLDVVGTSASNTITIKPAAGVQTVIPGNITQTTATFRVGYGSYIILDGSNLVGGTTKDMTIVGLAPGTLPAVHLYGSANNNVFKNLIIESQNSNTGSGTFLFGSGPFACDSNLVENCTIKNIDTIAVRPGVGVYFFSTNTGNGNRFNNLDVYNFADYGFRLQGAPTTNTLVTGCNVYMTAPSTKTTIYGAFINRVEGLVIENNTITDLASTSPTTVTGIYYGGSSISGNAIIRNNFISVSGTLNLTAGTIRGIDYFGYAANSFEVYFNSIYLGGTGVTAGTSHGLAKRDAATIFKSYNNAVYNTRSNSSGTGKHYAVYANNVVATTFEMDYNNYFVDGIGGVFGFYGAADVADLLAWQTATGKDSNSVSGNPLFTSATDLHIPNGSVTVLESAGTPIAGITTDIDGQARNVTTPDIGADEFTGVNPADILAGDYYIPQGANPQGFSTLAGAITALNTFGVSSAVRFLIDGNLNEIGANLLITRSDLTGTNNLTIKPAPTKTPSITITGCTTTAGATQYSGLAYSGASNITIDGSNTIGGTTRDLTLAMNDSLNGRIGITLFGNTDDIFIRNLIIKYNVINTGTTTSRGIYVNGQASGVADSLIIENCIIGDMTYAPAYATSVTGSSGSSLYASKVSIKNNELFGTMRPVYFFYGGVAGSVSEISGNTIQSPYAPPSGNVVWGMLFNTFNGTFNIHGNILQTLISASSATNGVYGIGTLTSQPGVQMNIYNNFLGGNFQHTGTGIPASVDVISFQDNIPQANVNFNTIVLNNVNKPTAPRLTGIRWGGTASVNLMNNIVINENDVTTAYALYSAGGTFTSNYNDLYVSGANANIGFSGVARQTFQTWQDSTGQDANSVNVAAPFTSALNFHIPDGTLTPIESGGTPIALITNDIDGQLRNASTPDIGADEFTGMPLIFAPTNLTAVADTFAILLNWTDNSANELGFYIERKNGDSLSVDPFVVIDTVGTDVVAYNDLGRTPNTTYTYRVQAFNLLAVSPYSNEVTATTIIPVELTSFAATANEKEISIVWSTATELNNRGFDLERKLDADWQKVAFVEGKGTTTEKSDYSYSDKFAYESFQGTVQYRLKQMDFNGTVSYSSVISVEVDFTPKEYTLYQNYPNPFNPSTTIKFALPFDSNVRIAVYNLLGEQVDIIFEQVKEVGYHNVSWNASSLASGVYFYTIEAKSIDGLKNFNSVKKMMLVK